MIWWILVDRFEVGYIRWLSTITICTRIVISTCSLDSQNGSFYRSFPIYPGMLEPAKLGALKMLWRYFWWSYAIIRFKRWQVKLFYHTIIDWTINFSSILKPWRDLLFNTSMQFALWNLDAIYSLTLQCNSRFETLMRSTLYKFNAICALKPCCDLLFKNLMQFALWNLAAIYSLKI